MKVDLRHLPKAQLDFIKPMLARPVNQLPSGTNWLYELKLDGYRALVLKKRGVLNSSLKSNTRNGPKATTYGIRASSRCVTTKIRVTFARNDVPPGH